MQPTKPIVPQVTELSATDRPQQMAGYIDPNFRARNAYLSKGGYGAGGLRTQDLDVRRGFAPIAAEARTIVQNSGFIAGAIEQAISYIVGPGLKPSIEPDYRLLGWSREYASEWSRSLERYFAQWANDQNAADFQGRKTFGALLAEALRSYFVTGDILGEIVYEQNPRSAFNTHINLIDPVRVATPFPFQSANNPPNVHSGIELDQHGRALAYWIKPLDGQPGNGLRLPAHYGNGIRRVVHLFMGEAGQVRGISPLGPVVGAVRQFHELCDEMTRAAQASAHVFGVVTADVNAAKLDDKLGRENTSDVSGLGATMEFRAEWHDTLKELNKHIQLGDFGTVIHLATGERFEMLCGKQHYEHFVSHAKLLQFELARALGLPYAMLSMDQRNATYSSGRLAMNDFWAVTLMRRANLVEPLCNAALAAVCEELIASRYLPYPGNDKSTPLERYRQTRTIAIRTRWHGPPRPTADELKSTRAAVLRHQHGITSLADECAAEGNDWENTLEQKAIEAEKMRELKVPSPFEISFEDEPEDPPPQHSDEEKL